MTQKEFEKLWNKVMDDLGRSFVEKCIDNIYDKIEQYKKEDEIFKDFFKGLDENQINNYKKIQSEELVFGYSAGILDVIDHNIEYSIQYIDFTSKKEYSINGDFSDALVGEHVAEEIGWVDRFTKKIT